MTLPGTERKYGWPLLLGAGLICGLGILISRLPFTYIQAALSVPALVMNLIAFGLLVARARLDREERLGWLLLAASIPPLLGANVLLGLADGLQHPSGAYENGFLLFYVLAGSLQAGALLAWPWRRHRTNALEDLLVGLLFSSSVILMLWLLGLWNASLSGHTIGHSRLLALTLRLGITAGPMAYLLVQDPRRLRGPLGWLLGSLVGMGASVFMILPILQAGGNLPRISPVFIVPILTPLFLVYAAWFRRPVEVRQDSPGLRLPLQDLVPYVPFVVSGTTLALILLRNPAPRPGPTLAFLAITSLLILSQLLLHRRVRAEKASLEDRVDQRTQAIEKMQAILLRTERMNAMATLGAGLTHDLNNLLGVIEVHAGLMQEEFNQGRVPKEHGTRRILEAAERAKQFTRQIMAFGRKPAEGPEAPAPLAATLEGARPILEMLVPPDIQLHFDLDPEAAPVAVDAKLVEQILVNLVANARDAMPQGGRITLALFSGVRSGLGRCTILEITDTGQGIAPDLQELIFEPFFTTKPEGQGTGLGLPMVRTIMESLGGGAEVESQPGRGATFRLFFPAALAPSPREAGPAPGLEPFLAVRPQEPPARIEPGGTARSPWLITLVAGTLFWAGWILRAHPVSRMHGILEIGLPVLLCATSTWQLWKASARPDFTPATRASLRWMLAGTGMVGLGAVSVLINEVLMRPAGGSALIGVTDILCLSAYPLVLTGQLRLPRRERSSLGAWRLAADSAIFVFGVGIPLWVFALHPALRTLPGPAGAVSLIFPALAFVGVVTANFVLLRCAPFPSQRAFYMLLAGIAIGWVADLIFALQVTDALKVPNILHIANAVNGLSMLMVAVGAWWVRTDPQPATPTVPILYSPIPMLTIGVIALWLARYLAVFEVSKGTLQGILAGVVVIFFVLFLREGLTARDSFGHAAERYTSAMRAKLEALVRHSSDLILVLDRDGAIQYSSPATGTFLGQAAEQLQGQPLARFIHPEDQEKWRDFLRVLPQQRQHRITQQWRMRDPRGEWRVFETSGSNLLANPDVLGIVLNTRDITDRLQAEGKARQDLKMEALGRLAGGIAHDFNNLLSAILGNLEMARMDHPEDARYQKRLLRTEAAAARGAGLTRRLLSFARRRPGSSELLEGAPFLAGFVATARTLAGPGIRLQEVAEPGTGAFRANREELEQALEALVRNAAEAMPGGGLATLSCRAEETLDPALRFYLLPGPGPYLVLEVGDTGAGMDEGVLVHLFEPFFTTKGQHKGGGLGLVGVYGIVNSCHGGISIRSEAGAGTTVGLWFPRVEAAAPSMAGTRPSGSLQGSEAVLLVEDEAPVREALKDILGSLGYRVHAVSDAGEARAFLAGHQGPLDLLVTDVIMPGDSGPKLAEDVARDRPGLRVLFISGYTADELEAHGIAEPGAQLLEKPFTREQIGRRIRDILSAAAPAG